MPEEIQDVIRRQQEKLNIMIDEANKPYTEDEAQAFKDGAEAALTVSAEDTNLLDVKELNGLPMLPEAPAAINFKYITPGGWLAQFTMRDESEADLHLRFIRFTKMLLDAGCQPTDFYGKPTMKPAAAQPSNQPAPAPSKPAPAPSNPAPPTVPANPSTGTGTMVQNGTAAPANPAEALSFPAELLVASMHEGKTYWKVKGAQFTRYGVTIWPEVMKAAGFDADALDIHQQYSLAGFHALYALNDNGQPSKVTALVEQS